MINTQRRENIKRFGLILFGITMFRFINLKEMFKENKNIYSKDNKLMVEIT